MPRMSRTDRKLWAGARTLTDLGELTAQWLEGRIGSHPGCYDANTGPDPETEDLMPQLAAANRAGFLTENSQPGYDGRRWVQRAAVTGFTDTVGLDRIRAAASRHRCLIVQDRHVPCTTVDGETVTWFGGRIPRAGLRAIWRPISVDTYRAVLDAHQIAVISPDWGPGGTRKLLAALAALR